MITLLWKTTHHLSYVLHGTHVPRTTFFIQSFCFFLFWTVISPKTHCCVFFISRIASEQKCVKVSLPVAWPRKWEACLTRVCSNRLWIDAELLRVNDGFRSPTGEWGNFLNDCIRDPSFLLFLLQVSMKARLSLLNVL